MELQDLTGFVVDYSPTQLKFKKYQLPRYITDENGKEYFEAEELLAIILDDSRKAEKWVPTDQRKFTEDIQRMYFEYEKRNQIIAENKKRISEFKKEKIFYYLLVIITFGFYGRNEPTPSVNLREDYDMKDVENMKLYERTVVDFHTAFKNAYSFLRSNGYLHAKTEDYTLYIYPSEKVLEDVRKFTLPDTFYTEKWCKQLQGVYWESQTPFFFILK